MKHCMAYRTFLDAGIRCGGGLGFQSGTVRPAHGHSGNGDAHRLGRRDLGSQSADQRGRGAAGEHASTALTTHTRKRSKAPSRRANWRTSWCCPTIFSPWTRRKSRTSRSSARWWAARRSTKHKQAVERVEEAFSAPRMVTHTAPECSLSYSQVRAKRKCLSTVASDAPRSSQISGTVQPIR